MKPEARARLNSVFIISLFLGQTMGTSVGAKLYTIGGWTASSGLSMGFLGLALLVHFARGPHASTRWLGWQGGSKLRKQQVVDQEEEMSQDQGGDVKLPGKEDVVMVELGQDDLADRKQSRLSSDRPV